MVSAEFIQLALSNLSSSDEVLVKLAAFLRSNGLRIVNILGKDVLAESKAYIVRVRLENEGFRVVRIVPKK